MRVDPELRRLADHGVLHAVLRVEPEFGATWPEPASEISRLLATALWVRPSCSARVRSTLTDRPGH